MLRVWGELSKHRAETGKMLRRADTQPGIGDGAEDTSYSFKEGLLRGDFVAIQKVPELLNWEEAWKKGPFLPGHSGQEGIQFPNAFISVLSHSKFYLF